MKWNTILGISCVMVMVAGGMALAAARHGRQGGEGRDGAWAERRLEKRVERVLDELAATDAQKAQVREVLKKFAPDVAALRGHREQTHEELAALWTGGRLEKKELRAAIDRTIEEARAAGYRLADAAAEVHGILTPDQRAQLADMLEERHGRRGGRW